MDGLFHNWPRAYYGVYDPPEPQFDIAASQMWVLVWQYRSLIFLIFTTMTFRAGYSVVAPKKKAALLNLNTLMLLAFLGPITYFVVDGYVLR
jgi:hypothetical protein